ncbi:unnamed protein product [Prunus armeniaca]|uniref:MADS-box domain-containing protein n=1 Tax=Prunus armeniaca TaxID=36596 RepID=A0A6J5VZ00_PRUAR|nr:unnamed protein product [Prunus armeniaca]
MEGKKTRGRQKIDIKKIENEDDRLITFSKRRSGIYKKASELAALCGAEVGIVVFSPKGKPYSYGSPAIEYVANRFLNAVADQNANERISHSILEVYRQARVYEANENHNELVGQLEAVKERSKVLQQLVRERGSGEQQCWWEPALHNQDSQGVKKIHESFKGLVNHVCTHLRLRYGSGSNSFDNGIASSSTALPFHATVGSNPNSQSH